MPTANGVGSSIQPLAIASVGGDRFELVDEYLERQSVESIGWVCDELENCIVNGVHGRTIAPKHTVARSAGTERLTLASGHITIRPAQRETTMTKPWVALVAGACGVLAVVIVVNHFRSDDAAESARGPTRMAKLADRAIAERSGGRVDSGEAGSRGGDAPGSAGGSGAGIGGREAGPEGARGSAAVIVGGRRAASGVGVSGSSAGIGADGTIRLDAPRDAAVKFERPGGLGGGTGGGTVRTSQTGAPVDVLGQGKEEDPNGPKLSLSFKGTADPETGEAPILQEGITLTEDGAKFDADARFALPNPGLTGEAGTFSFNVQPDWSGPEETDASLVQFRNPNDWNDRIQITKNGQYLRFIFTDDTGNESGAGIAIRWNAGEQHQVTATWGEDPVTGQKLASLYVDGRLAGQSPYYGNFNPPNGPLYIGSDLPGGGPGARGTISDFKAYDRRLAPDEIASQ